MELQHWHSVKMLDTSELNILPVDHLRERERGGGGRERDGGREKGGGERERDGGRERVLRIKGREQNSDAKGLCHFSSKE